MAVSTRQGAKPGEIKSSRHKRPYWTRWTRLWSKWSREDAYAYLRETVGERWSFETDRYIAWPAQSAGYKIGMVKILELRQEAMDELGDQFDIKEFHRVVLGNGSMPLDILERVVRDYIAAKQGQ